ncbi:glycosyltransferase [Pontibacter sp. G13]|uniref:glycosyltransferase n=1 Tax=Pontibacter sp. G13 TaxID=3074898 RepID=UPI003906BEB5
MKDETLLVEVAWEVANQVGGIYTVIRSKVPSMTRNWGDRYCLIGPYVHPNVSAIFEDLPPPEDPYGRAVRKMREMGFEVHYGRWLTAGRPRTVLFNPWSVFDRLGEIKYLLWEHHGISLPGDDDLINQVAAFGWLTKVFLTRLCEEDVNQQPVIAHVHEWMAATSIPEIRRDNLPIKTVFTTHATMLGRYLAMNDPQFYEHLPFYDWEKESKYFNIETRTSIERAAAHGAHVLTTVSEVTARECIHLLGRKPDLILPNGLNISPSQISHEVQNVHQEYKEYIHRFIMGHFFPSYHFDLDKTLYFFTSGRYEYRNKGYDLTLEALARLNWRLKEANIDRTVVMFFVTKRPFSSINPNVLQSRLTMDKIRQTTEVIQQQIGEKLFLHAASNDDGAFPDLNQFVEEYWRIRLRRELQSWRTHEMPTVVTHNLYDDGKDDVLNFLRTSQLLNYKEDKVKVVYHPDFINSMSPLFGVEYGDFVRGCHLGIFPSYYEPWGYTPLECMVSGVPAITSDLSGFGDYVLKSTTDPESFGLYVVNRRNRSFDEAANQLADQLFSFVQMSRGDRIGLRYKLEKASEHFEWSNLTRHYEAAYDRALAID